MDETEYRLEESISITLDSSGTGNVINVGPTRPNERWEIEYFGANGSARAKLIIVRGNQLIGGRQIDITRIADADTSPADVKLRNGERISFWWTNGTSGAAMNVSIVGKRFVAGRRAY